jgi:hypothetical protein
VPHGVSHFLPLALRDRCVGASTLDAPYFSPASIECRAQPNMTIYSTINYLIAEGEKDGKLRGHKEGACRQLSKLLRRHG